MTTTNSLTASLFRLPPTICLRSLHCRSPTTRLGLQHTLTLNKRMMNDLSPTTPNYTSMYCRRRSQGLVDHQLVVEAGPVNDACGTGIVVDLFILSGPSPMEVLLQYNTAALLGPCVVARSPIPQQNHNAPCGTLHKGDNNTFTAGLNHVYMHYVTT